VKETNNFFLFIAIAVPWIMGIAIAHGFWSTLFSIMVPMYSWYLVAEHFMKL
jgi:hypothetical protein